MPKKAKNKILHPHSKQRKIILIVFSVLAVLLTLLICIQLSFTFYFNNKITGYLQTNIYQQTKGEYKISIKKLRTNIFNQSMYITDFVLTPDLRLHTEKTKYYVTAEKIALVDFKLFAFLLKKDLIFDRIRFVKPAGKIFKGSKEEPKQSGNAEKFTTYKKISKSVHSVTVRHMEIKNAGINFYDDPGDMLPSMTSHDNVLKISNLMINEDVDKSKRWFLADAVHFTVNRFDYKTKNGLYTFRVKSLVASSGDSTLTIDSLQLIPNYNKHDFGYKKGTQTDRMSISFFKAVFEKIDVKLFFEKSSFLARNVNVDRFMLEAYRDKNIDGPSKKAKSLQQLVKSIRFYVRVDSIHIKNSQITYEEVPKGATLPGRITFNKVKGVVTGLTNDKNRINGKSFLTLNATCLLMNQGYMLAHYDFPLETDSMVFDCAGKLTNFPVSAINPTLEPLAYLSMKEGEIDTLIFNFHATEEVAKGKMELRYHDLKVKLLRNNDNKEGKALDLFTLPSKRILVAILVKHNNPTRDRDVRITEIKFPYNQHFIFNYTWKSILSGVKPAIGIPSKTKKIKEPPPK